MGCEWSFLCYVSNISSTYPREIRDRFGHEPVCLRFPPYLLRIHVGCEWSFLCHVSNISSTFSREIVDHFGYEPVCLRFPPFFQIVHETVVCTILDVVYRPNLRSFRWPGPGCPVRGPLHLVRHGLVSFPSLLDYGLCTALEYEPNFCPYRSQSASRGDLGFPPYGSQQTLSHVSGSLLMGYRPPYFTSLKVRRVTLPMGSPRIRILLFPSWWVPVHHALPSSTFDCSPSLRDPLSFTCSDFPPFGSP